EGRTPDETKTGCRLGGDDTEMLGRQLIGQVLEFGPTSARRAEPPAQRPIAREVETEGGAKRGETPREIRDEESPARSATDRRDHDGSRRAPPGRPERRRDQGAQHSPFARRRDRAARN